MVGKGVYRGSLQENLLKENDILGIIEQVLITLFTSRHCL